MSNFFHVGWGFQFHEGFNFVEGWMCHLLGDLSNGFVL